MRRHIPNAVTALRLLCAAPRTAAKLGSAGIHALPARIFRIGTAAYNNSEIKQRYKAWLRLLNMHYICERLDAFGAIHVKKTKV